ncbi:MAG: polysaccharide biosynthesis C-terminal domain-containing protein, partial [Sulfurihydrogenibium sp.]|nr:polysaccharide biosynthesis C-terminal domain-containing protein [Sulfurihydrogenibium sp.]
LGLIPLKFEKEFSRFVMIAGFLNVILCLVLSYLFSDIGASISLVLSETILLILIIIKIKKIMKELYI